MMSTYDIRNKEVINIYDGRSLGFVEDVELNLEKGTIEAIIIPGEKGFFGAFQQKRGAGDPMGGHPAHRRRCDSG